MASASAVTLAELVESVSDMGRKLGYLPTIPDSDVYQFYHLMHKGEV